MTTEETDFFINLLKTIRPSFETLLRGVDPMTMRQRPHQWPDHLDLLDHGIALLENRVPQKAIEQAVRQNQQLSYETLTPTTLLEPKE